MNKHTDKCIALAAMCMATEQIDQIAYQGRSGSGITRTLISSLFANEAQDVVSVYGSTRELATGFKRLISLLSGQQDSSSMEIMHYIVALFGLSNTLLKNPEAGTSMIAEIERVETVSENADDGVLDQQVIRELGEIYQNRVSPLGPRIMVKGEQEHLQSDINVATIRTLLLAGIRAAVLWQQSGGNRFTLMFSRKALITEADTLLQSI